MPSLQPPSPLAPLRIVHINTESGYSGGEVQVFLLLEGLRRRGYNVALICPPASASEILARQRGIDCRVVPMRSEMDLRAVHRVRREVAAAGADVVHLHTGRANWLGGLAARWAGVPAVSTRRMDRRVRPGLRTRFLYGTLLRRVAAISPAVRDRLLTAGVRADRIEVIVDAVDPEALRPEHPRDEVRSRLGAGPEHCVLIAVAALVRRKGIDILLEAIAGLDAADLRVLVWIVGEGRDRQRLEERGRRLGIGSQLSFLGRRGDIGDLLHASDIAVLPSRQEGMGVAALEAMAASRPVVASDVGGLSYAVVHGRTGLLVPPEDPAALASELARLIRDPELRQRLGAAGPQRIAEGFLPEQMIDAYERLYARVAGKGAGG